MSVAGPYQFPEVVPPSVPVPMNIGRRPMRKNPLPPYSPKPVDTLTLNNQQAQQASETLPLDGVEFDDYFQLPPSKQKVPEGLEPWLLGVASLFHSIAPQKLRNGFERKFFFDPVPAIELTPEQKAHELYITAPSGNQIHALHWPAQHGQAHDCILQRKRWQPQCWPKTHERWQVARARIRCRII